MPAKTSKIKLDTAFAQGEPALRRAGLLPGGWWLWCLLGLGLGLGLWTGGRRYLRSELTLQLSSAENDGAALASIDALMRLDGNAAVDVSRALAHPDFVVAHAAYRALNEQLDASGKLDAAERIEQMTQLVSQLEDMPRDCDQDHRILVTGLASRLYADALGSRDSGASELLERCKRIMERKPPTSFDASPSDMASSLIAQDQFAPIESSLSDTAGYFTADGSAPAPLPPIESARSQVKTQPSDRTTSTGGVSATAEPALPLASGQMPRLSTGGNERTNFDAARVHLTGASTRQATLVDRPAAMTLSDSGAAQTPAAVPGSDAQDSPDSNDRKLRRARPFDASGLDERVNLSSPPFPPTSDDSGATDASSDALSSEDEKTLAGIDRLPIDQLVRLLSNAEPQVAQAAALALRRKGMDDVKLDLAMQLALGSSPERLQLLQSLGTRGDLDPRPWLLWMAADGDLTVREQAVGMLAPLLDQDVRRELRLLLSQERDERVAQTIRRVLMR